MKELISIVAQCATEESVSKKRIIFSRKTGLIEEVQNNVVGTKEDDFVYPDECLLFSGMGDIHIHAREDKSKKNVYKEDFHSACCAALNGGVIHVADMPNNPIPPIDDLSYLEKANLAKDCIIPILMYAGIGPNTNPLSFKVPYKAFMGPSIGELFFKSNEQLELGITKYKNQSVSFHCEDPVLLEEYKNRENHFLKRPVKAEVLATDFALYLIEKYHLQGKLCHYSSGEGLDSIIAAKGRGVNVTCEVTPQHLFFNEEYIRQHRQDEAILFQMNPPIRNKEDQEKMLWAFKNGHIDYLATDHAPHSKEEKLQGISGMPGLDTYGPFVTWLINEQKIAPELIAKCVSSNPGRFHNQFIESLSKNLPHYRKLGEGFGFLKKDYVASFTLINLHRPCTILSNNLKSKAHWTPFHAHTFSGSVEDVFVMGNIMRKDHS